MARPRAFDVHAAVATAGEVFARLGYSATSIDDLVNALGVHRGSLYQAFGSKRGLFVVALRRTVEEVLPQVADDVQSLVDSPTLDLVLIAALELAPEDREIRDLVHDACVELQERLPTTSGQRPAPADLLGRRLLERGRLTQQPITHHT